MTAEEQVLDELVRLYAESGIKKTIDLVHFCAMNDLCFAELQGFVSQLRAEGSLTAGVSPHTYRLTDIGNHRYARCRLVFDLGVVKG